MYIMHPVAEESVVKTLRGMYDLILLIMLII